MTVMVRRGLLALLVCVHCLVVAAREEDTLAFHLSKVFSEVSRTNDNAVALRVIEGTVGFFVRAAGDEQGHVRTVRGGEVLRLAPGGWYRLGVPRSASSLMVALTNEVPELAESVDGAVRRSRADGPFLFVQHRAYTGTHGDAQVLDRRFAVDVSDGRFYDYEKHARGRLEMPFHSLWKDWAGYLDYKKRKAKTDGAARLSNMAEAERNALMTRETLVGRRLQEFCAELTFDKTRVVLYRRKELLGAGMEFSLALIRQEAGQVKILGTATFFSGSSMLHNHVAIFDDAGRLLWWCQFQKYQGWMGPDDWCGAAYEFDAKGHVARFVELDVHGKELPYNLRTLGDRQMVESQNRAAFLAEARDVVRPLLKTWLDGSYEDSSQKSVSCLETTSVVPAGLQDVLRKDREVLAEVNRKRQRGGLSALGKDEERLVLREIRYEESRRWFERMRHAFTGRKESTAHDRMMDLERVRLNELRRMLVVNFPPENYPKTLRELVGRRGARFGQLLLPGGEDDLRDQWGHEYRYGLGRRKLTELLEHGPVVTSAGPDGIFDTEDDLSSDDWYVFRKMEEEQEEPKRSDSRGDKGSGSP